MISIFTNNNSIAINCQYITIFDNERGAVDIYDNRVGTEDWIQIHLGRYKTKMRAEQILNEISEAIDKRELIYNMPLN